MIRDVVIIKDGIPLLSKNYYSSQNNIFSKYDDLVLISGFFSALNSFSDQFEDLGSISELRLSKSNFKLSLVKDPTIPNLLYLATFDKNSKGNNVQRYLKNISRTFLKNYNAQQITKWAGRVDAFKSFEKIINRYVEDEKNENDFNEVPVNNVGSNSKIEEKKTIKIQNKYKFIPFLKISQKINPNNYLTGDSSLKVFNQINGEQSIDQIAHKLKMERERVYAICKNLIKFGFVSFK